MLGFATWPVGGHSDQPESQERARAPQTTEYPALAVETFYIMFDNTMKGKPGACSIMTSEPTDKNRYKMMGKYGSKADAETAMHSMKDCA